MVPSGRGAAQSPLCSVRQNVGTLRTSAVHDHRSSAPARHDGAITVPRGRRPSFRASLRDYAAERTHTPHAEMEAAIAHAVRNKAKAAYGNRSRRRSRSWSSARRVPTRAPDASARGRQREGEKNYNCRKRARDRTVARTMGQAPRQMAPRAQAESERASKRGREARGHRK